MSASSFDPAGTVRFDLNTGAISLEGEGRAVLVPESVLEALISAAGAAGEGALRALGASLGATLGAGLSDGASPEDALHRAAGVLARVGLGRLSMEVWGPALCFALEGTPRGVSADAARALLEGLVSAAGGRDVAMIHTNGRFLVVAPSQRDVIAARAAGARDVAEVVSYLTEGGGA